MADEKHLGPCLPPSGSSLQVTPLALPLPVLLLLNAQGKERVNERDAGHSPLLARAGAPALLSHRLTFSRARIWEQNGLHCLRTGLLPPLHWEPPERVVPGALSATLCLQPCPTRKGHSSGSGAE